MAIRTGQNVLEAEKFNVVNISKTKWNRNRKRAGKEEENKSSASAKTADRG